MNDTVDNDPAPLLQALANALHHDRLDDALTHAERLCRLGAMPVADLFSLGGKLGAGGREDAAAGLYRRWLEHGDTQLAYAVQFNLATCLANIGQPADAVTAFRNAADGAPLHAAGQSLRLQALSHLSMLQQRVAPTGDVLIILNVTDLEGAVAAAAQLEDYRTLVFEPGVVDKAIDQGLRNVEFVEWPNGLDYFTLDREANVEAYAMEAALTDITNELMPEVDALSWQHLHLYYLIKAARWYGAMWPQMLERLRYCTPHLFINDNPLQFYWPSFLPALQLGELLRQHGIVFRAFVAGARNDHPGFIPHLAAGEDGPEPAEVLTHLPTCFYDMAYANAELQASGKKLFNIPSKYWNVPVEGAFTPELVQIEHVRDLLEPALRERIDAVTERLRVRLDELLAPWIGNADYRDRQATHMARLYRAQIWTYFLLEQYFGARRPGKMLLADHDTDYQGPLVSYAARHAIPILIFPHSKVSPDLFYRYRDATCLMHPIGGERVVDAAKQRVPTFKLAFPFQLNLQLGAPAPLRTIGLMLNAITTNSGVYNTQFQRYMGGIRDIVAWCLANGVELLVRCKPSFTTYQLLHQQTGLSQDHLAAWTAMPMQQFAAACDACVMYDAPTSGALEFLNAGIPVLNAVPEELSKPEARVCDPGIVPRGSVAATLRLLDELVADPMNVYEFRATQFQDYVRCYDGAQLLRTFL